MSATKKRYNSPTKKRYNSLDKKVAEEPDVNDTMETEMENGAAKREEQEKIKSLLADTDKLIGNEEAHGDSTSDSEPCAECSVPHSVEIHCDHESTWIQQMEYLFNKNI